MAKVSEREQKIRFIHEKLNIKGKPIPLNKLKNCTDEAIDIIIEKFKDDYEKWLVTPKLKKFYFITDKHSGTVHGIDETGAREQIAKDCPGEELKDIAPVRGNHLCPYCRASIVRTSCGDELCDECKADWGHSLYSEL